jgi:predicted AlkP superfamily phosphohydrolase/phosphomutase
MNQPYGNRGSRIVGIGMDSADFHLVDRWMSEGKLPALAGLVKDGGWTDLVSTADVGSGTVWPTLFTGSSPAKHNGMGSRRMRSGTYAITHSTHETNIVRDPFWVHAGRSGRRVAVIDVPRTRPEKDLNGFQMVGWGAHSPAWHGESWPPALFDEVIARFGKYPVPDCDEFIPMSFGELRTFRDNLMEGIRMKRAVSADWLVREKWDLFITVFSETHCAGHNFWHLMDSNHPRHDPSMSSALGGAMLEVYSGIDSAIAELQRLGEDISLFIFSPEGMGPNYTGSHLMPEILRRLGVSAPGSRNGANGPAREGKNPIGKVRAMMPAVTAGPHAIRNLKSQLPGGVVKLLEIGKRVVPRETWHRWKCYLMTLGNDWNRSLAFCFPSDFNGAVRINLKGREPKGRVEPGQEYDALVRDLMTELGRLKHADTGESAVAEVVRVDEVHSGPFLSELPDIVVKWRGDRPIRGLQSDRIGTVTGENHHERSGAHRPVGFLLSSGKHIVPGSRSERGHVMDIAPTVLYLMGVPVPREMEGRVLLELIDDQFREDNPVVYR